MPSDEVPIKAIIENLQRIVDKSEEENPTTNMWRRSNQDLDSERVEYAEWNLPGIDGDIIRKYNVGDSE